jgi:hypothetical protein
VQQYGFPRGHRRNLNPCYRRERKMA